MRDVPTRVRVTLIISVLPTMPSSRAAYTPLPPTHPGLINDVLPPEIISTIFETLVELVIDSEDEDEEEGEDEDDDEDGILWRGDMCGLVRLSLRSEL